MKSGPYTNEYLDTLNELKEEIDQRSDQPLDKLSNFIWYKTFGLSVRLDLLFAVGLMKAPERFFIRIRNRSRSVYLILRLNDADEQVFIGVDILDKDKIDDQKAREALLSKADTGKLKVSGVIRAAKKIIKTCKIERI